MARVKDLVREVRAYCEAHANPDGKAKWDRYFKEGFDAWGLLDKNDPLWTVKLPEWAERYSALGIDGFVACGNLLFPSGKYEEGAVACRLVEPFVREVDDARFQAVGDWFAHGISNWAQTDAICGRILGPALANGQVRIMALRGWRGSKLPFQRRAVPVSLLKPLKKGFPGPMVKLIWAMMLDDERVVHQGLGWFLREAWKREPELVERFLMHWKDRSARLIFQYATEKMTASQKARFRREKK